MVAELGLILKNIVIKIFHQDLIMKLFGLIFQTNIKKWNKRGLGWIAEIIGESKIPGYTNIMTYFGSSVYDTSEMSRLIDGLVSEAEYLGIETMTPNAIGNMMSLWDKADEKYNSN